MISFISGIIDEKQENLLVLETGGIGYKFFVSSNTLVTLPSVGEMAKVYTNMIVREDDISLYGFSSREEREMFNLLITVSGVGPKLAISVLSGLSLSDLSFALVNNDVKLLSKIKGLGKKTAERLCLELHGKISGVNNSLSETQFDTNYSEDAVQMATDTLISLGISKNDAYMLARSNAGNNATAEEIISKSLRGYKG